MLPTVSRYRMNQLPTQSLSMIHREDTHNVNFSRIWTTLLDGRETDNNLFVNDNRPQWQSLGMINVLGDRFWNPKPIRQLT